MWLELGGQEGGALPDYIISLTLVDDPSVTSSFISVVATSNQSLDADHTTLLNVWRPAPRRDLHGKPKGRYNYH
jgi:hypothetical protein